MRKLEDWELSATMSCAAQYIENENWSYWILYSRIFDALKLRVSLEYPGTCGNTLDELAMALTKEDLTVDFDES